MGRARRLLGVMVPARYRAVTAEMFELFKTCWEPVQDDVDYEAILCHSETAGRPGRSLTIITGGPGRCDATRGVFPRPLMPPARIEAAGIGIDLLRPWLPVGARGESSAWSGPGRLRLGYDLFGEIEDLLTKGQVGAAALNATAGRHLDVLRSAMLEAGLPVVEVEAVPAGTSLTVAVTHDVDFARMCNHFFDRTAAGFLYRATVETTADFLRGRASLRKLGRNFAAALKLPLVYLGWARDPWNCFAKYAALEQKWRSTFYVIPRRDHPGRIAPQGDIDPIRACRYQASDVAADLTTLEKAGFEVGLQGLDAWAGLADAAAERSDIRKASSGDACGVRMHWLYFSEKTYEALESAGFDYDSTCGFNDAIGFRAGTGQVFRPLGADHLVEIPLIIQDTALFFGRRMRLDEDEAFSLCEQVISEARTFGGGITLLWHMRSIGPERWWDGFYRRLLDHLEAEGAWLAPAAEIVEFYRRRRSVDLDVSFYDGTLTVRRRADGEVDDRLQLRVRFPHGSQTDLRLPLNQETLELAVPA
jgi:hypothetical protein